MGLGSHFLPEATFRRLRESFIEMPAPARGVALFAVAVALHEASNVAAVPFIYFQF